jgi:hypothetical protein
MLLHMVIFCPMWEWLGLFFGIVLCAIQKHWHLAYQHLLTTHGLSFFPAVDAMQSVVCKEE